MAKGIFAEALKFVTASPEARSAEINGVVRSTRYAELLHDVGFAGQRPDSAAERANKVDFGLVNHARGNGPGVMQAESRCSDGLGQFAYGHEVIVNHVFAAPGIAFPEVHVGLEKVIKASCNLVTIRWNACDSGEIVTQAGPVWSGHIRGCKKSGGGIIPTLLRNLHTRPKYVCVGIRIEASSRKRIAGEEFGRAIGVSVVWHVDGNPIVREVAILDVGHGHGDEAGEVCAVSQSFISAEVKQLVSDNFPPRGCAELVPLERGLGRSLPQIDAVKEIPGIK